MVATAVPGSRTAKLATKYLSCCRCRAQRRSRRSSRRCSSSASSAEVIFEIGINKGGQAPPVAYT